MNPKHIEDIIDKHKFLKNAELEIRFYLSNEKIKKMIPPNSKKTLSVIQIFKNSRKESFYESINKISHREIIEKKQIANIRNKFYKIALSQENPTEIDNSTPQFIRIKYRYSWNYNNKWRFDVSFIKRINPSEFKNIKKLIQDFFNHPYGKLELEAEAISKDITPQDIENVINFVFSDIDIKLDDIIRTISRLLRKRGNTLKKILPHPKQLNKTLYHKLFPQLPQWYITEKADGIRICIFIQKKMLYIITDEIKEYPINIDDVVILDAELYNNIILIFDCYFFNGNLKNKPLEKRIKYIEQIFDKIDLPYDVRIKSHLLIGHDLSGIKEKYESNYDYETDGLIFTSPNNYKIYKWKPYEKLTIDFLCIKVPDKILGQKPYDVDRKNLHILFCGINDNVASHLCKKKITYYDKLFKDYNLREDYYPMHFSVASNPNAWQFYSDKELDGKIIELAWQNKWQFYRIREDKENHAKMGIFYGNDYRIAEDIFNSYAIPFTYEYLINPTEGFYFIQAKDNRYKPLTKFNNFVKAQVIKQFQNKKCVIDLASGKGQDLFTYKSFGVDYVIFLDQDAEAIRELNNRKYDFPKAQSYVFGYNEKCMEVSAVVQDITQKDTINTIKRFTNKADGVVINLAIHYILPTGIEHIFDIVDSILKENGKFVFTTFDGKKIFDLLKDRDEIKLDDKYHIKKKYTNDSFNGGEIISVKHPFSGNNLYDEPLVNLDLIINYFTERGYKLIHNNSFIDKLNDFKSFRIDIFEKLTKHDLFYTSLYSYITLVK